MIRLSRAPKGQSPRLAAALIATALLFSACQPGWASPFVGSPDGTGPVPGATSADNGVVSLPSPTSVAAIPGGGFYLYDSTACAIYNVGNFTTSLYAGTPGVCTNSGDNGPAIEATINATVNPMVQVPYAMALDGAGNLFFPSGNGGSLRRVDGVTGIITRTTIPNPSGGITFATGLATDTDGSLVASTTSLNPVTGSGTTTHYRVSSAGTFSDPFSFPTNGNFGLANTGPGQFVTVEATAGVVRVDLDARTISNVGVAAASTLSSVLAGSPDGTIYMSNQATALNQVVRIDTDNTVTVIAGNGTPDPGTTRQSDLGTDLNLSPTGLALTPNDGLLISSGHVVYRLNYPQQAGTPPVAQ